MQTPGSILLHLDSSARTPERIKFARQLANGFGAEVFGQPCVLTALVRYPFAQESAGAAVTLLRDMDKDSREKMHTTFLEFAGCDGRMHWVEPLADGPWGFARQALYADLVILGQHDPDDPAAGELPADFVSSLLLESGRPALVLPCTGAIGPVGRTVLVAWKETREAAHALSAALPWLQRSDSVHAVCFGEDADAPLKALHAFLKVHGVGLTMHAGGPEDAEAGRRLLSMASDVGADLLVMGCHGHGCAHEWVLGDVTRTVLTTMPLTVLMAH